LTATFPAGRLLRPGATTAGWSEGGATALEEETYFVAAKVSRMRRSIWLTL
jgi:hypothetical protein